MYWKKTTIFRALLAFIFVVVLSLGAAAVEPFTFVQIADTQLGMGGYERDVRNFERAVKQINAMKPDFVVICGDLVEDGQDDAQVKDFKRIKAGFEVPCHCVAGNHDLTGEPTPELLERYRRLIGKDYYAFEQKGLAFVVMNTQLVKSEVAGESEKHFAWLKGVLEGAKKRGTPVIVAGHYALFTGNPDEEEAYFNLPVEKRKALLDLFRATGVVAYLSGHSHKNIINTLDGIQFVTNATTSRNFDDAPMGFRVWRVKAEPPYDHEYVAIQDAEPYVKKK